MSRRELFTGKAMHSPQNVIRPPWSLSEPVFSEACTSCHACIEVCLQGILQTDAESKPFIEFEKGECTFCGACAEVCPAPVFADRATDKPWPLLANVNNNCLGKRNIICQSCSDVCDNNAICFTHYTIQSNTPRIDDTACTGCGACVSICPANAIEICVLENHDEVRVL